MVTRLYLFLLLFPLFLFSGEFSARVRRNTVGFRERFNLQLTLKDASARENPSVSVLEQSFLIESERQSTDIRLIDGKFTAQTVWTLTLVPRLKGEIEIPSIEIVTSEGTLSTLPILLRVTENKEDASSENNPVSVETSIENLAPYKNEPFTYTIKIKSESSMANVGMQKIETENALLELSEEPKIYTQTSDGRTINIIELRYLVTPLQAGTLQIPRSVIKGIVFQENEQGPFSESFNLFSALHGFNRTRPFVLETEEIALEVQPAVPGIVPWLPAKSLKMEETLDLSQSPLQGEPFTGTLTITAEGLSSAQLPDLSPADIRSDSFKIYADRPELRDERQNGTVIGTRTERYTFIPQRPGPLEIPEISLVWWDVAEKREKIARIPARTVEILPAFERKQSQTGSTNESNSSVLPETSSEGSNEKNLFFLFFTIGSILLLSGAGLWIFLLQRKIKRLTQNPSKKDPEIELKRKIKTPIRKQPAKDKREKLSDLNPT